MFLVGSLSVFVAIVVQGFGSSRHDDDEGGLASGVELFTGIPGRVDIDVGFAAVGRGLIGFLSGGGLPQRLILEPQRTRRLKKAPQRHRNLDTDFTDRADQSHRRIFWFIAHRIHRSLLTWVARTGFCGVATIVGMEF